MATNQNSPGERILTDNPQPSGPRSVVIGRAIIYIVWIRVCHPCGMVFSAAHDSVNLTRKIFGVTSKTRGRNITTWLDSGIHRKNPLFSGGTYYMCRYFPYCWYF